MRSFIGFLLDRFSHIMIKGIAVWSDRQPDVWGDVGHRNFLTVSFMLSCLCEIILSSVTRHGDFQHPFFRSGAALLHPATWCSPVCWVRPHRKINWGIASPLRMTTSKYHDVDPVFGFYPYRYILWGQSRPMVILQFHHLILEELLYIWEKPKHVGLDSMFQFVQKLCRAIFPLLFHDLWWKLALHHLLWEILCLHALPAW